MNLTPRKPSLRGLRTFCAAARHRTLREAADELYITPSAVSHQVKSLENELGLRLFERSGRSLELTAAGRMLFEQVNPLLIHVEAAAARVQSQFARVPLRVSVQPFFASELLVPRLAEFTAANPGVDVSIDAGDGATEARSSPVDVWIRLFAEPPAGMISTRLFGLTLVPACAPALRDRLDREGGEPSGLFPYVVHSTRPTAWKSWATQSGVRLPESGNVVRLDSMSAVMQAAERGLGVALVPLELTRAAFAEGRLVRLFEHALRTQDAYWLVRRAESRDRRDVKAFSDWVVKQIAGSVD